MQQQQNYLGYTVVGTTLTILLLLVLYAIPEFDLGPFHFKRINIVADILKKEDKKPLLAQDTVKVIKPIYADTCKRGITCIEDYSTDTSGLNFFLSALDSVKKVPVRIAYFADSYVEGDIMLDPLRDTLQAVYGGSGVGFVPITSEVAGFRQTLLHSFDNWKTLSIVGDKDPEHPLGFSGYTAIPNKGNKVLYRAISRNRLNDFPTTKIFYGNCDESTLYVNGDSIKLKASKGLNAVDINSALKSIEISTPAQSNIDLYGASFESKTGVVVDNFSMRGNSGIGLSFVKEDMYKSLDSLHHYDLVVLAYGLNVASDKAKDYNWYIRSMNPTIAMIKKSFPNSSILLIGCSDRGANVDGDLKTMPMLKELVQVQRNMAMENHICFWNMFEAMGGDSTMVVWAGMGKHAYANKDYTHLTFYGGKKMADILMGTLLYEKEKYDRRKKSL